MSQSGHKPILRLVLQLYLVRSSAACRLDVVRWLRSPGAVADHVGVAEVAGWAAGRTGSRTERLGRRLSLIALGLFVLYLATNSPLVAALGVAGTLVPGCLLTSCDRSQLIELERRALGWRLMQPW